LRGTTARPVWNCGVPTGTSGGTSLVKDIIPGAAGGTPVGFARAGTFTYFTATTDADGWEL
jgi:hypothetical protein